MNLQLYKKITIKYYILIFCIYMFVFQFLLEKYFSVFKYWDEFYSALFIPFFFLNFLKKREIRKYDFYLFLCFILYIAIGLYSNISFNYQEKKAVIGDVFLNSKFFMSLYATMWIFGNVDFKTYSSKILKHVKTIVFIVFVILIIDAIRHIFPQGDPRFGLYPKQLFFGHPTGLASVSMFLLGMLTSFLTYSKINKVYFFMALILMMSSLRFKAIAIAIVYLLVYYLVVLKRRKLTISKLVYITPIIFLIGWKQITVYFGNSATILNTARGALTVTSLKIAKDYFPLGTGFGTFASYFSGTSYSPIYYTYGINSVWGLQEKFTHFVSDSFWPMVLGQVGVIGFILFCMIIYLLYKKIQKIYLINIGTYLAAFSLFIYVLISSSSEAAFVSPMCLPDAFWIGYLLKVSEKQKLA